MEGQVPVRWNSDWVDGDLVSSREVGVHICDTAVQHPDVRGGDSIRVVECGFATEQVCCSRRVRSRKTWTILYMIASVSWL